MWNTALPAIAAFDATVSIRDPEHIEWLNPNGIEFLRSTIAQAESSDKFSTTDMYSRSELTLEVWIAPADVQQRGPARIVSYSKDPHVRNLTLGQHGRDIVFRLRTPVSGLNGTRPALETEDQPLKTAMQHVVVTYHNGVETLYVNGEQHETTFLDKEWSLFDKLEELFGVKHRWAYWSLVIFPVGFLCHHVFFWRSLKHRGKAVLLSALIGVAALGAIEGLQVIMLRREVDLSIYPVIVGTVLLSILTSVILSRNVQAT